MPEAVVGLGSNDAPFEALRGAVAALRRLDPDARASSVYRSAAVGAAPAPDYFNMAVRLTTTLDAAALRAELASIETALGRSRADPAVCRIDLDLLLYGAAVDAALKIPRAGAFAQPYSIVPLAEIAPSVVHPLTGTRASAAAQRFARGKSLLNLGALDG
jgi:2-amino-4-hydroxy-6-hydroxymethyldihydropteridine diphosphokinase